MPGAPAVARARQSQRTLHARRPRARLPPGVLAAPRKFEVKKHGALNHSNGYMAVFPASYPASNFTGSASSAAACRTAPCRPKATDLLTSALPHHQAPGALTPGWPCVAVLTRVVSDRRGTPLPGRHVRSRRACTPSDVCAHGLLYQPFTHLCRDVTPPWGVHRFRGITLAKTGRENLSRRGMDGREARHQRVHIYTGGSTPCNGSTRSDGRLAS